MSTVLLINCTARKAAAPARELQARSLPKADLPSLAREWGRRVRRAPADLAAGQLYSGRGFRDTYAACAKLGARLAVVSAGLGIVAVDEHVPAYGLTVSTGHRDSIQARCVASAPGTSADWWRYLGSHGQRRGLTQFLADCDSELVVIALPAPYLQMLTDELASLRKRDLARIRIVGPKSATKLPVALHDIVMPYDNRLNGPDTPIPGTELDFPHRAAISFLKLVRQDKGSNSIASHSRRVRLSLSRLRPAKKHNRERLSDARVRAAIKKLKDETNSMATALKLLRSRHQVACEQQRFRKLWMGRRA
jgi:hypothetical protein